MGGRSEGLTSALIRSGTGEHSSALPNNIGFATPVRSRRPPKSMGIVRRCCGKRCVECTNDRPGENGSSVPCHRYALSVAPAHGVGERRPVRTLCALWLGKSRVTTPVNTCSWNTDLFLIDSRRTKPSYRTRSAFAVAVATYKASLQDAIANPDVTGEKC